MTSALTSAFWEDGYQLVDGLLDESKIALASASMNLSSERGDMLHRSDPMVLNADDEYSPVIGDMLLSHCRAAIEEVVGEPLVESHAYWRIYRAGGVMKRHKDRPACEVSATITIESEDGAPDWPISIKDLKGHEKAVTIKPGAGLVYQGHKVEHWRDALPDGAHKQLFMFYVLRDGDFTQHAFDQTDGRKPK